MTQLTSIWRVAGVVVLAIFCISYGAAKSPDPHWIALTGTDWEAMTPAARAAYLQGFLAGGALAQAMGGGRPDSATLVRAVDSLRRAGFRMPYAPNVYAARLEDYYWYQDRLPRPLWYALWEVNRDLQRMMQADPHR